MVRYSRMQEDTMQYVQQHGLEGFIRISNDEYTGIPQGGWLAHFNLEQTTVKAGHTYALPRILKHGYLDPHASTEVLPILSYQNIYHGTCLEVRNRIPYEALTAKDFEYSLSHISNVLELQKYIVMRYSKSKPYLSREELLALGVSRILLKIVPASAV